MTLDMNAGACFLDNAIGQHAVTAAVHWPNAGFSRSLIDGFSSTGPMDQWSIMGLNLNRIKQYILTYLHGVCDS